MDHQHLKNWHFSRWLSLLAGAFFAGQALYYLEVIPGMLGIFLLYQAGTGSGCLGYGSCDIDMTTQPQKKMEMDEDKGGRRIKNLEYPKIEEN